MSADSPQHAEPLHPQRLQAIRARAKSGRTPDQRALRDLVAEVDRLRSQQGALTGNPLTRAETTALIGAALGETAGQTATRLNLSFNTIKSQLMSARRRLGAASNAQAVAVACLNGWLTHKHISGGDR